VATADKTDAPIYDILIAERGDIPADARHTAEQTHRTAARVLNWNSPAQDPRPTAGTLASGAVGDRSGHGDSNGSVIPRNSPSTIQDRVPTSARTAESSHR
jgi:hypothetical protein